MQNDRLIYSNVASSKMDGGPTPFMIGQAMDSVPASMPGLDFSANPNDMMSIEPAWLADINDMDWVSNRSAFNALVSNNRAESCTIALP